MEFFLPSVFLMLVAILFCVYLIPQMKTPILLVGSTVLLAFGLYSHYATFSGEYRVMDWLNSAKQIAPTILTLLVIVLAGGYIAFMYSSGKAPNLRMPSFNSPPPETATNVLTENIGNGLEAMGATNVARNNAPLNNAAASALSQGV
jgi:hypothetical protein